MISLLPIGPVGPVEMEFLKKELDVFGMPVRVLEELPLPDGSYDSAREQYSARALLKAAGRQRGEKVLGITSVDLYVESLSFVFGLAQKGGRAAVISTARLRPGPEGDAGTLRIYLERCKKEAIHELGHTMGLAHCHRRKCVMHFSNCVHDTDVKDSTFCRGCRRKLSLTEVPNGV